MTIQIIGFLISWFAVITQLIIIVKTCECSLIEAILRFFGYFTLSTNLIVAFYFSVVVIPNKSKVYNYFTKISVSTAIAVYITIVAVLYNILLRFTWQPQGLQKIVDELLHALVPIIFIVHWLFFAKREFLLYKKIWTWLLYPAAYLFFISIRAIFRGYYPYYFVNVSEIGILQVAINVVAITIAITGFSYLFVWLANAVHSKYRGGNRSS